MKIILPFLLLLGRIVIAQPIAEINVIGYPSVNPSVSGMAPLTVNVHALNSQLNGLQDVKSLYEWDFGDLTSGSSYNNLDGWNASHTYGIPGTYNLSLSLTDENGLQNVQTITVNVVSDTRTQLYLSTSTGSDQNDGLTPNTAKGTLQGINSLIQNNTALNILSSDTINTDTFQIYLTDLDNVIIRTYGGSQRAVFTGGTIYSESNPPHINISRCNTVTIQNIEFTSPLEPQYFPPFSTPWNGIYCTDSMSTNITIRNNLFDNIGFCISTWNLDGLSIINNDALMVGKYLFYGAARYATIIGNTCEGTTDGICIRTYHGPFNISYNDLWTDYLELANQPSQGVASSFPISLVIGSHFYVNHNETHGAWMVGYVTQFGLSAIQNVVIEGNILHRESHYDPTIRIFPNDDNIMIRNNIFYLKDTVINTEGIRFEEPGAGLPGDSSVIGTVWIYNNTFIGESNASTFINLACNPYPADTFFIQNNLAIYPNLNAGSIFSWDPYMIVSTQALDRVHFSHNLWQTPLSGEPFRINGNMESIANWNGMFPTDSFAAFNSFDLTDLLSNSYTPSPLLASNGFASPVNGVFKDAFGNLRNNTNWTAGAVENLPITTSIPPVEQSSTLYPFPNPFSEVFAVNIEGHNIEQIFLINIMGQEIINKKTESQDHILIDTKDSPQGLYFLILKNTHNKTFTLKVLKE